MKEKLLESSNWMSEERKKEVRQKRLTRKRAIRLKCLDCMYGSANEVKLCPSEDCPLFNYRLGVEAV